MWEKGWVEGACSEVGIGIGRDDGFTDLPNRVTEITQHVKRRKTADGREMP